MHFLLSSLWFAVEAEAPRARDPQLGKSRACLGKEGDASQGRALLLPSRGSCRRSPGTSQRAGGGGAHMQLQDETPGTGRGHPNTASMATRVPVFTTETHVVLPEASLTLRVKSEARGPTRQGARPSTWGSRRVALREGAKEPEEEKPARTWESWGPARWTPVSLGRRWVRGRSPLHQGDQAEVGRCPGW